MKMLVEARNRLVNSNNGSVALWIARHKLRQRLSSRGCAFPGRELYGSGYRG